MKTVLIVDDERPARELLKMELDWEDLGFETPYEASNGMEALNLYERIHPDLIITDIQMPIMDGLDLISIVREQSRMQKFIILSCHESFAYAREAMRLGVLDYFIKDAITGEVMYDTIARIFSPNNQIHNDNVTTATHRDNNILSFAVQEDVPLEQLAAIMRPLLTDRQNYFCCVVKLENLEYYSINLTGKICDGILNVLRQSGGGEVCLVKDNIFLCLGFIPKNPSRMEMINSRFNIIQNIRVALEDYTCCDITVGVSSYSNDPLLLRQMIGEARKALDSRVFLGNGRTIYYDPTMSQMHTAQLKALNIRINNVKTALADNNVDFLKQELNILYQKDLQGMMQYNYLQHINTVLFGMLTAICSSKGIPYKEVFGTDTVSMNPVEQLATASEMCSWYLKRFQTLMMAMEEYEEALYSPRLKLIQNYISDNYCYDISLSTVADRFGIHKVYLAKIFKEKFGQNVNEYIRELRIDKAKELLCQENICISDIVEQLGFNNSQTFYNNFKQCVGVSPGKYRENHMIFAPLKSQP